MNQEEAKIVLEIMSKADHGCSTCVKELYVDFLIKFEEFLNLAQTVWVYVFPEEQVDFNKEILHSIRFKDLDKLLDDED